jgi:RNA polymerase sigma factor (sigma-70 family)
VITPLREIHNRPPAVCIPDPKGRDLERSVPDSRPFGNAAARRSVVVSPDPGLGEVRSAVHDDAEIYEEHASMLMRLATLLVGPSDAPDIVADAVVRAMASPRWPIVQNRAGYLVRSVQNEARRKWTADARRSRRELTAARLVEAPPNQTEPDEEVLASVQRLSGRQQAVVLFTYWADLPPAETAARLGISEGAVKRHLARARANLRRLLDEPG